MKSLAVYIHIPFCVQKCIYCDFLSFPADEVQRRQYIDALKREIDNETKRYEDYRVDSVFFGGGTPSILTGEEICSILNTVKGCFHMARDAEITIELNPGTADCKKLEKLKQAGINRLSMGLQSADDRELLMLGRIHTYWQFTEAFRWARSAGFDNINVDVMSALPGQTLEGYCNTLERVVELKPEHISAYSLIVEENTPLYEHIESYPPVPDEEEDRKMYHETQRILALHGYSRYEISNYAGKGHECRHNIVYWERGNYAGFGLGASSMVENIRWKNPDSMKEYLKKPQKKDMHKLSAEECMEEFMFLGLRMIKGVSKERFGECFGRDIMDVYKNALCKWESEGMLEIKGDSIRLTRSGIDVSNVILADFLL